MITVNYKEWIKDISKRYRQSQIKAAMHVNSEMLKFYFELGKEINELSFKAEYGSRFYEKLSKDLIDEMPDIKGLSHKNLRYMEKFYLLYKREVEIFPQVVGKLFLVPWSHHRYIIDKCKDTKQAMFFVNKVIENNWSRDTLYHFLSTNVYEREGKSINNFNVSMPDIEGELASQITRDPYNFDFLTIRKDYDEKELKNALMDNVVKFLLELGSGFSFVGKEYRLNVGDSELYIDMLFYNIQIHSYVVVELKTTSFKAEYIGQLSAYVGAVNHILKGKGDGQTIGLLICKDKNDVLAKYTIEGVSFPMGISNFEINHLLQENYKRSLPTIEEIEEKFKEE